MIFLDKKVNKPLYEQLYDELKEEIITNKLSVNSELSSVRVLSKELQISRNTVDRAYQQLLSEGYIRSVPGAGYYVEDVTKDYFLEDSKVRQQPKPAPAPSSTVENKKEKIKYDFLYSSSDTAIFPWTKWRRYVQNVLLEESSRNAIGYESNKGNYKLRQSLCGFLNRHRGVVTKPENVILCAGTQFGIDIICNMLPPHSFRLAYEEPGYDAMRNIFIKKKYSLTTVTVEEDGIDVESLDKTNCNLLYLTPSHQFPTGSVTSVDKRNRILEWAHKNNGYVIENDYDSEFRYGDVPIPSLQSLDKMIFTADDDICSAFVIEGKRLYSDNGYATGRGFAAALELSMQANKGKCEDRNQKDSDEKILIMGAGPVGSAAAEYFEERKVKAVLYDIEPEKAKQVVANYNYVRVKKEEEQKRDFTYFLDATPVDQVLTTADVCEGAIVSAPGMPLGITDEAARKATVIHNPLELGIITMYFDCVKQQEA